MKLKIEDRGRRGLHGSQWGNYPRHAFKVVQGLERPYCRLFTHGFRCFGGVR